MMERAVWRLARDKRRAAQQTSMTKKPLPIDWRLRLGIPFGLLCGIAGGFGLGQILVQLNARQAEWDTPRAFLLALAGSLSVGLVLYRLVPKWPGALRGLAGLVALITGLGAGTVHSLMTLGLDPNLMFGGVNSALWESEWLLLIAGLLLGTWPAWLRPLDEGATHLVRLILAQPFRFFARCARGVQDIVRQLVSIPQTFFLALAQSLGQTRYRLTRRMARLTWPSRPSTRAPSGRARARVHLPPSHRTRSKTLRARRGGHPRNGLRLISTVEDRCPYCFDVIKENDPRGVMVCEVCGTPHHADCWAVTHKCQVPHLNT